MVICPDNPAINTNAEMYLKWDLWYEYHELFYCITECIDIGIGGKKLFLR